MKRLILLIVVVLFYVACKQNNVPKGVMEKGEMLNVMYDMQLTDATLNQVNNNDTMKMQAHSRYNYLFTKYKIDSTAFSNSLKYYSRDAKELDSMYSQVSDRLKRLQESLKPKDDKMKRHNLYGYVLNNFKIDTLSLDNNLNYYTLDAKKLYGKYTHVLDSLKHLPDSLKAEPVQVEKIEKFKKATEIKNDLSTK